MGMQGKGTITRSRDFSSVLIFPSPVPKICFSIKLSKRLDFLKTTIHVTHKPGKQKRNSCPGKASFSKVKRANSPSTHSSIPLPWHGVWLSKQSSKAPETQTVNQCAVFVESRSSCCADKLIKVRILHKGKH